MGEIASAIVKLGARDDGLSAALSKAKDSLGGVRSAMTAVVPQAAILQRAMSYGVAGGFIYAGNEALKFAENLAVTVYGMGEAGAQAERLDNAFTSLWSDTTGGATAALSALDEAAKGTISNANLELAANRARMLGVSTDIEKLANLLEVASFRGRAMGLSTSQAFNDIVTGVGRMSPLILDNLGIVIDAENTWKTYAATVGKTAESLSATEKRQVLLNAVLEEGNAQIKAAGGLVTDMATNYEVAAAKIANAKETINKAVANAISPYVGGVGDLATFVLSDQDALFTQSQNYEQYLENFRTFYADYEAMRQGLIQKMGFSIYPQKNPMSQQEYADKAFWDDARNFQTTVLGPTTNNLSTVKSTIGRTSAEIRKMLTFDVKITTDNALAELSGLITSAGSTLASSVVEGSLTDQQAQSLLDGVTNGYRALADQLENGKISAWEYLKGLADIDKQFTNQAITLPANLKSASESAASSLKSAIDSVLQPTFAGNPTNTLDMLGMHIDTADEDARRMAAVMAGGLQNEWVQYFKDKGLLKPEDLVSEDAVRGAAARLLHGFELGTDLRLVDKETAKQRVKEILIGKQNMDSLINDIFAELKAEGFGGTLTDVKAAYGDATATGQQYGINYRTGVTKELAQLGVIDTTVLNINKEIEQKQELIKSSGKLFGSYFGQGAVSGIDFANLSSAMMQSWAAYLTATSGGAVH